MQTSHRMLMMDITTANEPVNPMAPSIQKSTSHGLRSSGTVVSGFFLFVCSLFTNEQPVSEPLQNTGQGPPPTYQTATAGIHFGFQPSANEKPPPSHGVSSTQNRSAPSSHGPSLTGFHSSSGSLPCTSTAPTSRNSSVAPFHPSPSSEGSQVPNQSSQVSCPLSRTYSVHNLEGHTVTHPSKSTHKSWPSQHQSLHPLNDDDNQSEDGSQYHQEDHANECLACDIEPSIDEVLPDEDDRMARRVLRGINNHVKLSHTDTFTEPTPEREPEDYNLNLEGTHQIPSDRDIGM